MICKWIFIFFKHDMGLNKTTYLINLQNYKTIMTMIIFEKFLLFAI
jgi:hypothetical protein